MATDTQHAITKYTILVDDREKHPYRFQGLCSDQSAGGLPLLVKYDVRRLATGDYTLLGWENSVAIERKSTEDAYQTFGKGRARFERELDRLNAMQFAAVVIENDWGVLLSQPPPMSQLDPKTVFRSVIAWQQRYPNVHWWMVPSRAAAEVVTLRILERFWKERQ